MKKALLVSILGISMSAVSSFGQGYIVMENYYNSGVDSSTAHYVALALSPGGPYLGADWSADLLYSIGGNPFALAAGSQTHFYPGSQTGVGDPISTGAGIFMAGTVTIPGYVSGPVQFQVRVFNGVDFASSALRGNTPIFTIASLQTNPLLPAGDLINNNAGG